MLMSHGGVFSPRRRTERYGTRPDGSAVHGLLFTISYVSNDRYAKRTKVTETDVKQMGKRGNRHCLETNSGELIFNQESCVAPLSLIALQGATELGDKINAHLCEWAAQSNRPQRSLSDRGGMPPVFFRDGKGLIKSSVRGDDLFILVDVGNYSCTYKMFGRENAMSPTTTIRILSGLFRPQAARPTGSM